MINRTEAVLMIIEKKTFFSVGSLDGFFIQLTFIFAH